MVYLGKIIVETILYFFQIAAKNGVYISLVRDVRHAFEGSSLVKVDCKGMHASDYKKLGAKLKVCTSYVLITLYPVYTFILTVNGSASYQWRIVFEN